MGVLAEGDAPGAILMDSSSAGNRFKTGALSFQFQVRQLTHSFAELFRDRTDVPLSICPLGMNCGG